MDHFKQADDLVALIAQRKPEHVCVVFGEDSGYTRRDLNLLAHETFVTLCLRHGMHGTYDGVNLTFTAKPRNPDGTTTTTGAVFCFERPKDVRDGALVVHFTGLDLHVVTESA